ncbi:hypothetical protein D9615_006197 [Tricholomella constricta]|uniref:Uncharacterized protein n=1 Tax=Tricholomella constricta TaxID=117010 RepID=A0A8H5HBE2_9AGAR|nr:hypothetical protein D9615_006197 [Tricholomella constricta]
MEIPLVAYTRLRDTRNAHNSLCLHTPIATDMPPKATDPKDAPDPEGKTTKVLSTDAIHPSVTLLRASIPFSGAKLHRDNHDWKKWERNFRTFTTLNHLTHYVFPPYTYLPLPHVEPRAFSNYTENLTMAVAALQSAVDDSLHDLIDYEKGVRRSYDALREHCQSAGPIRQVAIIRQALSTYCSPSEPLVTTANNICMLIDTAFDMGAITRDLFKCIALLNSLSDKSYETIQSTISRALSDSTSESPYTAAQIIRVLQNEQTLLTAKEQMRFGRSLTQP